MIDLDLKSCFDTIYQKTLLRLVRRRVCRCVFRPKVPTHSS